MDYDAIVIGCGHNGLVAGFYLAQAGLRVLALEQSDKVGGMASTDELIPDFHFTTYGHSFVMFHTKILDDMRLLDHGLQTDVRDPESFQPFLSGKHLLFWGDYERTVDSIAQISPRDAEAWPRWLEFHARIGAMFAPYLLTEPPTLSELARRVEGTADEELFYWLITGTIRGFLDDFFESEEMKTATIATFDSGSTDAPGALLYWAFHSAASAGLAARGLTGYARGGMGAVARALDQSAQNAGLEVRTNAAVEEILTRDGCAVAVRLADGTEVSARALVSNVDPQRTLLGLLPPETLSAEFETRLRRVHAIAGYFKLHCACHGLPDWTALPGEDPLPHQYAQARICESLDTFDEAWYSARRGLIPKEYSIGVVSTTVHDPSTAPPGHHCISIWGEFAPMRLREGSWE
ncbi:MAG TPA: NAD(P)/FAD-dependent oxidoreductase, partial [Dehalococcoidia bacterium]|nr:NAD(P)/FAD-dependent oxidoreductase [Dehalococcoidia bacterium]